MSHQSHSQNDSSQIQQGQEISQHQQSSQYIKVKSAGRKNFCQMCHNTLGKYTCPKCEMKTCSLQCTRRHKEVRSCTGYRQATEYVAKSEIDPRTVEKDYNFIEDMISSADKVKKVMSGVNQTVNMEPRRFKILRNNARQLYNVRLSNGPNILERHRDNISFFFVKSRAIYWVFQLLYYEGKSKRDDSNNNGHGNNIKEKDQLMRTQRVLTQPTSDQKTFFEILPSDYLNKTLLQQNVINTTKRQQFCVFLENKQKINEYSTQEQQAQKRHQNAVISETLISGKFTTLFELIEYDVEKKVCEQMVNVSIFQFPTLYVVHKSLKGEFLECYREVRFKKGVGRDEHGGEKSQRVERNEERQRSRQKIGSRRSSSKKQVSQQKLDE